MARVEYDAEVNMTYIYVQEGDNLFAHRTQEWSSRVLLDWDKDGKLIGVEYFGSPLDFEEEPHIEGLMHDHPDTHQAWFAAIAYASENESEFTNRSIYSSASKQYYDDVDEEVAKEEDKVAQALEERLDQGYREYAAYVESDPSEAALRKAYRNYHRNRHLRTWEIEEQKRS